MAIVIKSKGFTLVELMIVIMIISVFAAFAVPSYYKYIRSAARANAQSQMLMIAGNLERWRAKNLSYSGFVPDSGFAATRGSIASVDGATIYIPIGSDSTNYQYQLVLLDGTRTTALNSTDIRAGQGWIVVGQPNTANTILSRASRLVLNSQGVRCMTDIAVSDLTMKSNITGTGGDAALCTSPSKTW